MEQTLKARCEALSEELRAAGVRDVKFQFDDQFHQLPAQARMAQLETFLSAMLEGRTTPMKSLSATIPVAEKTLSPTPRGCGGRQGDYIDENPQASNPPSQ